MIGGGIAFLLALVQASSVEQFKVLGVTPNLLLVLLVSWLVVRGLEDVLPILAVAGVTLGLVGLQAPGVVLLALLPIAGLGIVRELGVIHSELVLVLLLVAGASLAYETVVLMSLMVTGGGYDVLRAANEVVLPAAIVNLAIVPPVYLFMRLARPAAPRRGFAS